LRFPFRAAAFVAASLVALFGAFYAGPSRAWEMSAAPIVSPYLDHATAGLDAGELSADPVAATPDSAPTPIPAVIAQHAAPAASTGAPVSLAGLVADHRRSTTDDAEHECLATAVYFESKGEPLNGQLSVAEVVLNRARSGRFPASVCGVVKQRGQFSFVRGGRFPAIARGSAAWQTAVAVAHVAREALADGPAPRALFFHARYVRPGWRGLTRVAAVGNHIFYR
jgi:N-acetylmuramoyl-L-alanine amidase